MASAVKSYHVNAPSRRFGLSHMQVSHKRLLKMQAQANSAKVGPLMGTTGGASKQHKHDTAKREDTVIYDSLTSQDGRGLLMNDSKMRQCTNLLKSLMNDPVGWLFNQPVDPVKLKIPDYFSIISKPMDLGTIKVKLEKNLYSSTHQFAEDVRLTFSNAMTYNPPLNDVHIMAKRFYKLFSSRWKLLVVKWEKESSVPLQQPVRRIATKESNSSKESPSSHSKGPKRTNQKDNEGARITFGGTSSGANQTSSTCMKINHPCVDVEGPKRKFQKDNGGARIPCAGISSGADKTSYACMKISQPCVDVDRSSSHQMKPMQTSSTDTIKEALVKAADAVKLKAWAGLKRQLEKRREASRLAVEREKQREASRLALEKIERSVDIDDNSLSFRALESFVFSKPTLVRVNLLEQLGLFIREDNMDEEAGDEAVSADREDVEEGEIVG